MELQIVLASGETRSVPLGAGGLVVGSATGCDVVIGDPGISPRHAFFQIDPAGAPTVQEMGTASPVSVNGTRISGTVALKSNDEIQIGSAVFRLAIPAAAPATPAVAAPPPLAAPPATPPAPVQPVVQPAAAAPPEAPRAASSGPGGPPPKAPPGASKMSPLVIGLIVAAVVVAIGLVFIALNMAGNDEAAPAPSPSTQAPPPASSTPSELTSPTEPPPIATPPVSKARVDGVYDGKYDFAFRADCPDGPCGGSALSGAKFNIPYTGNSTYRGHSTIRSTCSDGGVHVQAPYKVDLTFRPTDAAMIGDKWMATKVDITLTISRNPVVKKVRTSATTITTLTCNAYHKTDRFTGVYSG